MRGPLKFEAIINFLVHCISNSIIRVHTHFISATLYKVLYFLISCKILADSDINIICSGGNLDFTINASYMSGII